MKLSRLASVLLVAVLFSPSLFAAEDVTGKWSGSFMTSMNGGESKDDVAYMVLKQTGAELTGTAGPSADRQWAILSGKVVVAKADGKESTKLAFDVQMDEGAGPLLHFDLELVAGHLKGNAKAEMGGITMTAVADLTRVK